MLLSVLLLAGRRLPSTAPFLFGNTDFKVVQYNGRGILLADPCARQLVCNTIKQLSRSAHVLCLEEVHGHSQEIEKCLSLWLPGWKIFASSAHCADGSHNFGAGGVVIALCPAVAAGAVSIIPNILVKGRCNSVSINFAGGRICIINIHNYNLLKTQIQKIGAFLARIAAVDRTNPTENFSLLVGDFNFLAEGDHRFKIGRPALAANLSRPLPSYSHAKHWKTILDNWTELAQPFPTHIISNSESASRLDRGFTSAPANQILNIDISVATIGTPEGYEASGQSDHCPVAYTFGIRDLKPGTSRPIARNICKDPSFAIYSASCAEAIKLVRQPPHEILRLYNKVLLTSARRVRDDNLFLLPDGSDNMRLVTDSISRAIWRQDISLAKMLIARSVFAASILGINSGGAIFNRDPERFDFIFTELRQERSAANLAALQKEQATTSSQIVRSKLKGRIQAARRMSSMYFPRGKRLKLAGIRVINSEGADTTFTDPPLVQKSLQDYWGNVYAHKDIDTEAAEKLFKFYSDHKSHLFEFDDLELPDSDFFEEYLPRLRDSATGRNGIPYSAYKALIPLSAHVFSVHTEYMSTEIEPVHLESFNEQLIWFALKGVCADDDIAAYREASQLRTIFGSNCDAKIIAGAIASKITPPTLALTPPEQRGFCKGRQLSLNAVDLDTFMRAFNVMFQGPWEIPNLDNFPLVALFDFCNAFPTMLHQWLFLVLKGLRLPPKYRWLIHWLYQRIITYASGVGDGSLLFAILRGVKTGCPLSSILFLLGVNPIVELFIIISDGPKLSVTRVCADDFGSSIKHLFVLKRQASIFGIAAKACGLHLKPVKCVLIFSGIDVDESFIEAVRSWLRENIPEFAEFVITSAGKYLGWILGRNSDALSFAEPIAKYNKRVLEIVDARAPSTVAFLKYNERVAPVLSYVAQFAIPPFDLDIGRIEYQAIHKILRLPPQSMSFALTHRLEDFCAVAPIALEDYCLAVMYRFAYSERVYLANLAVTVQKLIGDSNTCEAFERLIIPDAGLNSPPILQSLFNALDLSGSHSRLQVAAATVAESFLDSEEAVWLTNPSVVSCYDFGIKKILLPEVVPEKLQGSLLKIFKLAKEAVPLGPLLAAKAVITLTPSVGASIRMSNNWYESLNNVFKTCKILLRVCWLKCIAGAWTTSARMHDGPLWPCIFGCPDAKDEVKHYFLCPILWQLSREQIGQEDDISIGERLCLQNPTKQKLRHLALCHITYHSCKNDHVIKALMNDFCRRLDSSSSACSSGDSSTSSSSSSSSSHHDVNPWPIVQDRAVGFCRAGVSIIGPP